MTVQTRQRSYTSEEKDGVLLAIAANAGHVVPTADMLGVPAMTVSGWWKHYLREARGLASRIKEGETLADRFLAIAIAAQDQVMATIKDEKSAYRSALVEGINLDKYLLLTGRPTSRTEVLRARYVEPASLRSLSSGVIDVESHPPQRVRGVRVRAAPSHFGANQKTAPSHLPEKQKAKRTRKTKVLAEVHDEVPTT